MLQFILELTAALLISYGFYREADIIKIERYIFKRLKRIIKNTIKFAFTESFIITLYFILIKNLNYTIIIFLNS